MAGRKDLHAKRERETELGWVKHKGQLVGLLWEAERLELQGREGGNSML